MCRRTRCGEREQRARAGARWTAGANGVTPRGHHHRPHRHATPETVLAAKRGNAETLVPIFADLWHPFAPPAPPEAGRSRRSVRPGARWPVPRGATPYARADHRALARARARRPRSPRRRVDTEEDPSRGRGWKTERSLRRAAPGFLKDGEPIIRSALDSHERFRVAARMDCGVACGGRPPHRRIAYARRRLSRSCRGRRAHGGTRGRSGVQDQRRGSRSDGG